MRTFLLTLLFALAAVCLVALAGCCRPALDDNRPSQRAVDLARSIVPEDPPPCDPAAERTRAERLWQAHQPQK
jgi:hypothetical protein